MRNALVLGGSSGIGLGAARSLSARGIRIAINGRSTERLEKARQSLTNTSDVLTLPGDVGNRGELQNVLDSFTKKHGGCDILVISGGGPKTGAALNLPDNDWHEALDSLVLGPLHAIRHVLPHMRAQKWGRIVLVASTSAVEPIPNLDLSNFIRPGLAGIFKSLSRAVAADGIGVSVVCPGSILTERSETLIRERAEREGLPYEQAKEESAARIPAKRFGTPEEIGEVIAFLCSEQSSYMHGSVVVVDGAATASW